LMLPIDFAIYSIEPDTLAADNVEPNCKNNNWLRYNRKQLIIM